MGVHLKIFISWSGDESKRVALLLKPWLKKLLQATEPWMSDVDIEPGTRWSNEIANQLQDTKFGILCVTPENRSSPWLNFEAGALSIAIEDTERRVVPLLLGYDEKSALSGSPVGPFNSLLFNKADMRKLILTMNGELVQPVDAVHLDELFDMFWPSLEKDVSAILTGKAPKAPKKTQTEMIEEILQTVRNIQMRQRRDTPSLRRLPPDEQMPHPELNMPFTRWLVDRLQPAERAVLEKLSFGMSDSDIAESLNMNTAMVEDIVRELLSTFQAKNRKDLYRVAFLCFAVPEN